MSKLIQLTRRVTSSATSAIARHHLRHFSNQNHSPHMTQLFTKSNSSFNLTTGISLRSTVTRLNQDVFLVDSGIGTPRICLQDELIISPKNKAQTRFENRVGFLDLATTESLINKRILERFFVDMVAGDTVAKERATARFNDMVGGSADMNAAGEGEPMLMLPRRYRQKRVWLELNKKWRSNSQVRGFIVGKVRGGVSVAIAGFIAYLPSRSLPHRRKLSNDRFSIESIDHKSGNIRVV